MTTKQNGKPDELGCDALFAIDRYLKDPMIAKAIPDSMKPVIRCALEASKARTQREIAMFTLGFLAALSKAAEANEDGNVALLANALGMAREALPSPNCSASFLGGG